jgi:Ca2+-binding RTX toxin-like protein
MGNDTYRFGRDPGFDEITDTAGTNRLALDAGIATSDVTLYRTSSTSVLGSGGSASQDDLVMVINSSAEQIRVVDHYGTQTPRPIEQIVFADGTVWDAAAIDSHTTNIAGTANTFVGTSSGKNKDDSYIVDHPDDAIDEALNSGIDSVSASVSYTLPANVENLTLTGLLHINGTGNALNNTITGNALDNVLDGRAGTDTLYGLGGNDIFKFVNDNRGDTFYGGAGNDTYFIGIEGSFTDGSPKDNVVELNNEGYDTVYAAAWGYDLPNDVERVIFQPVPGSWSNNIPLFTISGNALDNYIDASRSNSPSRNFVIDGGSGADTIIAVTGSINRVIVDNIGDIVSNTDANDTIVSSVSYTLPGLTGGLELSGATAISGTGNAADNQLNGSTNSAANVLTGGLGNDVYVLGVGDTAIEDANAGDDTVVATFVRSGGNVHRLDEHINVENLSVSDAAQTATLAGTSGANILTGNGSSNVLDGGGGDDVLQGSAGDDRYVGFDMTSGHDVIVDTSGNDALEFSSAIDMTGQDLSLSRADDDLVIGVSAESSIRIQSWYDAGAVEGLTLFNGGIQYDYTAAQLAAAVLGINGAPVLVHSLSNLLVMPGQALSYQVAPNTFSDLESQSTLSYSATRHDGTALPSWLSLDAQTGVFSGQPAPSDVGAVLLTVIATDDGGLSATTDVLLDVGGVVQTGTAGNDTLLGSTTPDYLQGLGGNDYLDGAGGNDDLLGGAGDDVLVGGAGTDDLEGGSGYDTYVLEANSGMDTVVESDGFDRIEFASGSGTTIGDLQASRVGDDLRVAFGSNAVTVTDHFANAAARVEEFVTYDSGVRYIYSASQIEALAGGYNSAPYAGTPVSDKTIKANVNWSYQVPVNTFTDTQSQASLAYSARLVSGAALPSWLSFDAATRTFTGKAPNGTTANFEIEIVATDPGGLATAESFNLWVRSALSTWTGTSGNDTTSGSSGHDYQIGLGGNDSLSGGAGNDIQEGGDGDDILIGGDGDDVSYGGAGNDVIEGGSGNDIFYGNEGNDILRTTSGDDVLIGGSGSDVLYGSHWDVFLQGGDGPDTYRYDAVSSLGGTIDNHSEDGELDRLVLQNMDRSNLMFSRSGDDLLVQYVSSQTSARVSDWFSDPLNRLDEIETKAGVITTADQIDALIASGQSTFVGTQSSLADEGPGVAEAGTVDASGDIPTGNAGEGIDNIDSAMIRRNSRLTGWALTDLLITRHLSGSDTAAIGGDLSYRNGRFGSMSDLSSIPAIGTLGAAGGVSAEPLQSLATLEGSGARLS